MVPLVPSACPAAQPVPGMHSTFWAQCSIPTSPDPTHLARDELPLYEQLPSRRRRAEWIAGRRAARAALRGLGAPPLSILRTQAGAPRLVGRGACNLDIAITHGHHRAAAVAGRLGPEPGYLGIDWVDPNDAARIRRIAARVLSAEERAFCEDQDRRLQIAWGAREAVAKATRTGMFRFALSGVHIEGIDREAGTVTIDLPGSEVRFLETETGAIVVFARVSRTARRMAQSAATGP